MTKKDMLRCYKDLSTCDMDKVEHVVNAIHKAFDTDNDGTVGKTKGEEIRLTLILHSTRFQRICYRIFINYERFNGGKT